MKFINKLFIYILFILNSILAEGQSYFNVKQPVIKFYCSDFWKIVDTKKDSLNFGKLSYNDLNENNTELLIGADKYKTNINSIWDLDTEKEKTVLEKTVSVDSFIVFKKILNQNQVTILDFNAVYKKGGNELFFKCRIYKYLLLYDNSKHVVSFMFISRNLNHSRACNNVYHLMKDVIFNAHEVVNDKKVIYSELEIPKLDGYLFYNESKYADLYTIADFTKSKTTIGDIEVQNIEFLVPIDELKVPALHIYKINSPVAQNISKEDFGKMKLFWKNTFEKTAQDNTIEASILGNDLMKFNIVRSSIITDTTNLLSVRLLLKDTGSDEHVVLIKNYILYKENVYFIDLSKKFLEYKDFAVLDETSYDIVEKIFKFKY